jgi:hypothetical protein
MDGELGERAGKRERELVRERERETGRETVQRMDRQYSTVLSTAVLLYFSFFP